MSDRESKHFREKNKRRLLQIERSKGNVTERERGGDIKKMSFREKIKNKRKWSANLKEKGKNWRSCVYV